MDDRGEQGGEVRREAVSLGIGGDDAQRSVAVEQLLGGEPAGLGGRVHAGAGVGVGQAEGGEQDGALAFLVDLPGGGVLLRDGLMICAAQDVLDLVAGAFAGEDPLRPAADATA